jgi:rubredoxin
MPTYNCVVCSRVFVPKEEPPDFNSTSGFRLSQSGRFIRVNGVLREDQSAIKCPHCGSFGNHEMSIPI